MPDAAPKNSPELHAAINQELKKPEYAEMGRELALLAAVRVLAKSRPEVFDPRNPADQLSKVLAVGPEGLEAVVKPNATIAPGFDHGRAG